jgi:two-component system chemotaxis response regulator CheB
MTHKPPDDKTKPARAAVVLEVAPSLSADAVLSRQRGRAQGHGLLIAMGSSTGGTEALRVVLAALLPETPPVIVSQHMPEMFTRSFAERLDSLCAIRVKEAVEGETLQSGTAYIAPGHSHLLLRLTPAGGYVVSLNQGSPVNRHRPSVDVMFRAAANVAGRNCIAVILTGMGRDGAEGMVELKEAGAYNLAQDEKSCVVFGMPREAILRGAAHEVLPLADIPARLTALCRQRINLRSCS